MSIQLNAGTGERIELALLHKDIRADKPQSLLQWHLIYGLFSAIDLMLTVISFRIGGVEMNPIANWFFGQYGVSSLITYKAIMVVLIAIQLACIGRHKLQWAKRIYAFGIATLVVASTFSLCQVLWFIHQYSWGIFCDAIRYAF